MFRFIQKNTMCSLPSLEASRPQRVGKTLEPGESLKVGLAFCPGKISTATTARQVLPVSGHWMIAIKITLFNHGRVKCTKRIRSHGTWVNYCTLMVLMYIHSMGFAILFSADL